MERFASTFINGIYKGPREIGHNINGEYNLPYWKTKEAFHKYTGIWLPFCEFDNDIYKGKFVLAKLTSLVPRYEFNKCVEYNIGIQQLVAVSTLMRSNENRNRRIYSDYISYLLSITRPLYAKDKDFF